MKELAIYALESLACSGILLGAYMILVERQVPFRWCRRYLLLSTLLAALIPLLRIPVWPGAVIEATPAITMPEITAQILADPEPTGITAEQVCTAIYALGTVLILSVMIWQAMRIRSLRRNAEITRTDRFTLVRTRRRIASFSFFRSIYIWQGTPAEQLSAIIAHEASHIAHRHSIERIVMECLKAALWWNPFVWIAARRLTEAEEFEADSDALNGGCDLETYMNTLFKQLFGYSPEIANGLRDSLTKKRFKMMTTQRPGRHSLLRLAATLPVMMGLFCAFSFTSRAAVVRIADSQQDPRIRQVILLNGKPATFEQVYQLDPACIDTTYTLTGTEVPAQYQGSEFVHYITTKGAPRNGKLITISGRVHYPDGKPAPGFDVFASAIHYVSPTTPAEMERLGAKSDAEGRYTIKASAQGDLWAYTVFSGSMRSYDSKGAKAITQDIEMPYPDSVKWMKSVDAKGKTTLLPQQDPTYLAAQQGQSDNVVIAAPKDKLVRTNVTVSLNTLEQPLPGAMILVKGTQVGVVTDKDGKATVAAPEGSILEVSYIDCSSVTLTVSGQQSTHTVTLMRPGSPTAKLNPLYIFDGIEISDLNAINTNIIDHLSVLSSPTATALYGDRGANGVVVIVSKSKATRDKTELEKAEQARFENNKNDEPFIMVETMPLFQGGDITAFRQWVMTQVRYPVEALNKNIAGRVVANFVIERDGSVSNINILQSPDKILSDEAVRALSSTPAGAWTPGKQRGHIVRVQYTLPIDFNIQGDKGINRGPATPKPTSTASTAEEVIVVGYGTAKK